MRKLLLIIVLGLCITDAQAQSFFNRRDPLHSFSTALSTVIPTQQGYVTTGVAWDSVNHISGTTAWQIIGVKFAVFDHNGQKVRDTIFERSHLQIGWQQQRNIYAWANSTQQLADGTFIVVAECFDTADVMRIGLVRLDSVGRGVWFREVDNPLCAGVSYPQAYLAPRDMKPDGQGGWLVLSTVSCGGSQTDVLLTKLDSAFSVVWHKSYGQNNRDNTATKILVENDGYLLAGGYSNANATSINFIHQAQLIKTDTAGNVVWTWLSDPAKKIYSAADVVRTDDGGYLYCGMTGVETPSANGQHGIMRWKGWIEKLDGNRISQWSKTVSDIFTSASNLVEQTVIHPLANGDYAVAGGEVRFDIPNDTMSLASYGSLMRLSQDGTTHWRRRYHFATDTFHYGIHDMKPTSDGGFVMVGQATDRDYPYNPPTQQGWIIKVDSNGCTSNNDPQCWPTAVESIPSAAQPIVTVFPNPVHETLRIRYNSNSSQAALLSIADLMGRKILQSALRDGDTPLDVSHLSPGLYLWRIRDSNLEQAHGTFIKL